MMKAGFDSSDILQIAGRLQDNAIAFYVQQSELSCDPTVRNVCYEMIGWWAMRRRVLSRHKSSHCRHTMAAWHQFEDAPFDPRAMASLAVFSLYHCPKYSRTLFDTTEEVFTDAITRCREVEVFYGGLKDFTYDQASDNILDELAAVMRDRRRTLEMTLGQERAAGRQRFSGLDNLNS